jgi:hypothetical protein
MEIKIEVFRDTEDRLNEQIFALHELLPKGVEVEITESLESFPVEINEQSASSVSLLRLEIQRLSENRSYRTRHISTTMMHKADFINILEAAGFVVIQEFQMTTNNGINADLT